ncbi:hypothetical protein BRC63_03515 [Halobacteriales archaeon QH_10_70_21]|nr:MAG: hypothetical protein BRC63_03515 [Halobacteriales archaeon QH_10_70_21]
MRGSGVQKALGALDSRDSLRSSIASLSVVLASSGVPYTYECVAYATRIEADRQPATCPECGARMRDISVPRE